jgi:hypothetical protein
MSCLRRYLAAGILWVCSWGGLLSAQTPGKIDFCRDIQPIFQAYCVSYHGPSQQMNGLRLDRRSATWTVLPGSSYNSYLYRKLIGTDCGPPMPPTGPLRPEQVRIIKERIDQGADWPEELAGEAPSPKSTPSLTAALISTRRGAAGETALDLAKRNGNTAVVDLLVSRAPKREACSRGQS